MYKFVLIGSLLLANLCVASQKEGAGNILRISASNNGSTQYRTIDVEGFTKVGVNCFESGATGTITMAMDFDAIGDSQYSLALSAYHADKKVRVKVDDSLNIGPYCAVKLIQVCKSDDVCI